MQPPTGGTILTAPSTGTQSPAEEPETGPSHPLDTEGSQKRTFVGSDGAIRLCSGRIDMWSR